MIIVVGNAYTFFSFNVTDKTTGIKSYHVGGQFHILQVLNIILNESTAVGGGKFIQTSANSMEEAKANICAQITPPTVSSLRSLWQ